MESMKRNRPLIPCKDCKGKSFFTRRSRYWTHCEDKTEHICIRMIVLTCKTCQLTTYYAQELDILDSLELPSQESYN